jgi:hypothetical protein
MAKTRFAFGREMTEDQILDAILKMAKDHGISIIDDRKTKAPKKRAKKKVKD